MSLNSVTDKLKGVQNRGQNKVMALCPSHNDRNPSLSIAEGSDGVVLIRCFAGCETTDVLKAVGLRWKDLFPNKR